MGEGEGREQEGIPIFPDVHRTVNQCLHDSVKKVHMAPRTLPAGLRELPNPRNEGLLTVPKEGLA